MERRVEDGDVRHVGERLARPPDRLERGPVVERREHGQTLDRRLQCGVDELRLVEIAPVHDPVADRVGRDEAVHRLRIAAPDEMELQTGGAGVDDKDVHRKGFS